VSDPGLHLVGDYLATSCATTEPRPLRKKRTSSRIIRAERS
jgi:hypothetical protein